MNPGSSSPSASKILTLKRRLGILGSILISGCFVFLIVPFRTFETIKTSYQPSDRPVVDRDGTVLAYLRTLQKERKLSWTGWHDLSPAFQEYLLKSEDKRFYFHPGVDPMALVGALWKKVRQPTLRRGASTLTMQLMPLIHPSYFRTSRKTFWDKTKQIIFALRTELGWSKRQILEAYVNLVPLRGELIGIATASHYFFKKPPSGLTSPEAAFLAALLRSPNADGDLVYRRACHLLSEKPCALSTAFVQALLSHPPGITRDRDLLPVISNIFIVKEDSAGVLHTSLQKEFQQKTIEILQGHLSRLRSNHVSDGAVLVLDNETAEPLVYVANAGKNHSSSFQIDGVQMRRQAGSTLKPFIYATAFEKNLLSPQSPILDQPTNIVVAPGKVYHPNNYDHTFRGRVSVADALASSLNVPAVKTLLLAREASIHHTLTQLGFTHLEDEAFYGPSLALGTVDVSLWELAHAYRLLTKDSGVFSLKTRQDIFHILSHPEYRRHTFGVTSLLNLPFRAAVKTGTSKDMRDNWCIGFTPRYTVGVWVGNFDGEPMWNVSGITGAAPVWRDIMMALPRSEIYDDTNDESHDLLPSIESPRLTRITYPVEGMLVGWDPDIPSHLQRLNIEIANPSAQHNVTFDGRWVGKASAELWLPLNKGVHRLALTTSDGTPIDEVTFTIR